VTPSMMIFRFFFLGFCSTIAQSLIYNFFFIIVCLFGMIGA
jgi:hypothetical protein